MTTSPPAWHPDPTGRFHHRYWDGVRWTEHVATAGIQALDPPTMPVPVRPKVRGGRAMLVAGAVVGLIAVVAAAVPFFSFVQVLSRDEVPLPAGPQELVLPAHRTYGVYVDDADNSGYWERCSATDARGGPIRMDEPSWNIDWFSDTENLDYVFDTGSGRVTVECAVPGETVTLRQVPNDHALLLGGAVGSGLFAISVGLLIGGAVVLATRPDRRRPGSPVG